MVMRWNSFVGLVVRLQGFGRTPRAVRRDGTEAEYGDRWWRMRTRI